MIRIMAARLVVVCVLSVWMFAANVAAQDVYTVRNVALDATGTSPTDARDKALAAGRQSAFGVVFRRLTLYANWQRLPQLPAEDLDRIVSAFTVDDEKLSTTRYLARASFTFNAGGVRSVMRRQGIPFSETQAKPTLVLAFEAGKPWTADGNWHKAWGASAGLGSLRPIVVPVGDALEIAQLAALNPAATDWSQLAEIAGRYQANEVWIVTALIESGGISIQQVVYRAQNRQDKVQNIGLKPGESLPQLMARSVASVRATADEAWKADTSVDYSQQASLEATVAFSGLAEWVAIRKELGAIRMIQSVAVAEMQTRGARIKIDYLGRIDQLQAALQQASLSLSDPSGLGQWVLARGSDMSSPPPIVSTAPTGESASVPSVPVPQSAPQPQPAPSGL